MKLLVGYDGSKTALEALKLASKHACVQNDEILVVTSMKDTPRALEGLEKVEQVETSLEFAQKFLVEKGIKCETHTLIRGMEPGEDIVKFAEEQEVDEIYIGVRRRSNLGKLVFGSVASFIILQAHCPVMTVK